MKLSDGRNLEIIDWGYRNHNEGPDFLEAKVKIEQTIWAGQIEMHVKASDWQLHGHTAHAHYDNVILHVVYFNDRPVQYAEQGESIPCLEIQPLISNLLVDRYNELMQARKWLACGSQFPPDEAFHLRQFVNEAFTARMQSKFVQLQTLFEHCQNDWEQMLFILLCRSFGFSKNSEAFQSLAESISYKWILKTGGKLSEIEALLFGQAGFLEKEASEDEYFNRLKELYLHQQQKYSIQPISTLWNFHRMRPANFPTVRIAQLAAMLAQSEFLFSRILAAHSVKEVITLFKAKVSHYWKTHYRFSENSSNKSKNLGSNSINLLIINVVCPLLFFYGHWIKDNRFQDKSIKFLESLPSEKNSILNKWSTHGLQIKNAYDSQALLHQYKEYCQTKQCMRCSHGRRLLQNTP